MKKKIGITICALCFIALLVGSIFCTNSSYLEGDDIVGSWTAVRAENKTFKTSIITVDEKGNCVIKADDGNHEMWVTKTKEKEVGRINAGKKGKTVYVFSPKGEEMEPFKMRIVKGKLICNEYNGLKCSLLFKEADEN